MQTQYLLIQCFNKAKEEAHKDYGEMKNEKLKKQAKIIKWFRGH